MHSYHLETLYFGKWLRYKSEGLNYLRGYLESKRFSAPRLAHRIMRSDGKVMEELSASEDVYIGLVAGYPTAEQYERAAARALEQSKVIRAQAILDHEKTP